MADGARPLDSMPPSTEIMKLETSFADLRTAALLAESRATRTTKLTVVHYRQPADGELALVTPGTVTAFVARAGAGILTELRKALAGDVKVQRTLIARVTKQLERRKPMALSAAVEVLGKQDVFGEIRYGGRALASNLFVPAGLDLCVVAMPYNGGRVAAAGFSLVEFLNDEDAGQLEAVIVVSSPVLTAAERAALRLVPADQIGSNIGRAAMCWAVTAVTVAAVVVLATSFCISRVAGRDLVERHLPEDRIKQLGPAASARALVALRRAILEERAGQR